MSTEPAPQHRAYTWHDPRPTVVGTGRIRCEGTAVHVGRRTAYATATIAGPGGRLLAHATTSRQIFQADAQRPSRTGHHAAHGTGSTC
ncbi:hypothetical protein SAZ11_14930 [Streptomyces sp. FXJ1.4098]|uniref:hypothetical protein n=1 Tax=Streptomyces sp. NPDC020845 TaxID=3365096 RepID=UPI002998DD1B|nr:hypothetical protein [Streptomyces sp. FXJ1.4098]